MTSRRLTPMFLAAVVAVMAWTLAMPTTPAVAGDSKRFPECGINSHKAQNRLASRYPEWESYFNSSGWDWTCRYLQYTFYKAGTRYARAKNKGNHVAAKRAVMSTGRWYFIAVGGASDGYAPKWVGYQYWKAYRFWLHLPLD